MTNATLPRDPGAPPAASRTLRAIAAFARHALYALVALALRIIVARAIFLSGQAKIAGPTIPLSMFGRDDFSFVLPAEIRPSTFAQFETAYSTLPIPAPVAAYLFSYAEFALPVCLLVGFATRLSALALFILTMLVQVYVAPDGFWTAQAYWLAILMVLVTVGPGALSLDALIRHLYRK